MYLVPSISSENYITYAFRNVGITIARSIYEVMDLPFVDYNKRFYKMELQPALYKTQIRTHVYHLKQPNRNRGNRRD